MNRLFYEYYYNGGGCMPREIWNNDGLVDIYFISNSKFHKLYLNKRWLWNSMDVNGYSQIWKGK